MDGWNTFCFFLGWPIFRCELLVSGSALLGNFLDALNPGNFGGLPFDWQVDGRTRSLADKLVTADLDEDDEDEGCMYVAWN